jgi:peptidase E
MTVGSNHVISKDDYLILKMTYNLALSKLEYNCGEGQNLFPYIVVCHQFTTQFPQGKVFAQGNRKYQARDSAIVMLCSTAHPVKRTKAEMAEE